MMIGLGIGINRLQRRVDPFTSLMSTLGEDASQLIAHPLEYGSMFQDRAGATPVTATGQLVGHVLDAGPGGYHATAISDSARGVFREVDGKRWIEYNGVNTAYAIPALPEPGVDKAQVFAGVRRLTDTSGIICELSNNWNSNAGSLLHWGGSATNGLGAGFNSASRGGSGALVSQFSIFSDAAYDPPVTAVVTSIHDIGGNLSRTRVDGVAGTDGTGDKGTGNYNPSGTYPLYYGARAGTSLFFEGRHYATLGPIVRFGTNATAEQIEAAEAYYTARVV